MLKSFFDDPLWVRIRDFRLDDPSVRFTFSKRQARENGWSLDFARRAIEEYKRFCYLGMRAGHPVTPSEEVDQAWHLHLLYTSSYWDEFCGQGLNRPFHHGPTRGGAAECAKFRDWYRATLDSYARMFGEEPPPDIWPSPEKRFKDVSAFRRINIASNWVIPKSQIATGLPSVAPFGWALLFAAGCVVILGPWEKAMSHALLKKARQAWLGFEARRPL